MLNTLSRITIVFPVFFMLATGCEKLNDQQPITQTEPPALQIAICDLSEIAKELGFIDELNRMLTRQRTLLDNEIRKLQAARQAALNEKVEAYGEFPDDEQKRELAVIQSQARQVLLQAQNRANQIFSRMRETLVQQIRTKIKRPVDQVATKRGINIVLTDRSDAVLYTASVADITPEVLSAARNANLGKLELQSGGETGASADNQSGTDGLDSQTGSQKKIGPSDSSTRDLFDE